MDDFSYTLIGSGRLGTHLAAYFTQLGLPFRQWSRRDRSARLQHCLEGSTHALLAIPDGAIEDFLRSNQSFEGKLCIHFSGCLKTPLAYGAHPLGAFSHNTLEMEQYRKLHFVIDDDAPPFEELLPGLPNAHTRIGVEQKAFYHSLCVLSANFSAILWDKFFHDMTETLNIPRAGAEAYFAMATQNIADPTVNSLTGPLTRNDQGTIAQNLAALDGDPFQNIYRAFLETHERSGCP